MTRKKTKKRAKVNEQPSALPPRSAKPVLWLPLHHIGCILAIVMIGAFAYANSLDGVFVLDDEKHIERNRFITPDASLKDCLTKTRRPIVNLTLAMNYPKDKSPDAELDPHGFRIFNVVVHILAGLTLFGLVRRTLLTERLRDRYGSASGWLAAIIALLWVAHPLQTQSVTYVIQRGESMMGMFYLLMLYCLVRSAESRHASAWYFGCVISCMLGMGCKAVMVTGPFTALMFDRVFLASSFREIFRRRWVLYLGVFAALSVLGVCGVMTGVLSSAQRRNPVTVGFAITKMTWIQYALTQCEVILHYIRLSLWPHRLCLDYYGWPIAKSIGDVIGSAAILTTLIASSVLALRFKPAVGFVCVSFFLFLAPTSSIVPIQDVAFEHRMYLSLASIVCLVVFGAYGAIRFLKKRGTGSEHIRMAATLTLVAVVAACVLATRDRNSIYHDDLTIWQDVLDQYPNSARAHYSVANALRDKGRHDEAIAEYKEAIRINPKYTTAMTNLGALYAQLNRVDEAMEKYSEVVERLPRDAEAYFNMGVAHSSKGETEKATKAFRESIRLRPNFAQAHYNLGNQLRKAKDFKEAAKSFRRAIRIEPKDPRFYINLGNALMDDGEWNQAEVIFDDLLANGLVAGNDFLTAKVHYNLGSIYYWSKRYTPAIRKFELVLQLNPNHPTAQKALDASVNRQEKFGG